MKNEVLKRILSSIVIIPIAFFFILKGSVFFAFFLVIFFLTTSYEWIKMNKKISIKSMGVIFLLLTSYSAYLLRDGENSNGLNIFLFVMVICIFTDIGGYTFGKLFKGPKLINISPNKTYSGMIGSFVFSAIAASLFMKNLPLISKFMTSLDMKLSSLNDLNLLFLILFISFVSQIGDLIISYFKRLSKIKNTGKIIPGHGGLLDRVDGMIFAFPFSYLIYLTGIFI